MIIKEYFTDKELACKCGCGKMPDKIAVEMLYQLRMKMHTPITVTSGARCKKYNKKIGGSEDSYHMAGAFDIKTEDQRSDEYRLVRFAQDVGFTGIGIKDNDFMHIDNRFLPAIWTY